MADAKSGPAGTTFMTFHVPDDPQFLAALGRVSIVHEHLDHMLKMLILSLTGLSPLEIRQALHRTPSGVIRDRIRKLAKLRLGEGPALLKVQAWMNRGGQLSERRNQVIHSLMVKPLDGEVAFYYSDNGHLPVPPAEEVTGLGDEIVELAAEINIERLRGFLAQALTDRPPPKGFGLNSEG